MLPGSLVKLGWTSQNPLFGHGLSESSSKMDPGIHKIDASSQTVSFGLACGRPTGYSCFGDDTYHLYQNSYITPRHLGQLILDAVT